MLRAGVASLCWFVGTLLVAGSQTAAVAQGLTAAEALRTAKKTGRPLLAVATSPTCGPCLALKSAIHGDASLRPLLDNFVYLEMDSQSADFANFRERFAGDFTGVPMVYMVRGDGAVMYGQSGSLNSEQLNLLLSHGITNSGMILPADQLAQLETAHRTARQRAAGGELATAMNTVSRIAELESFAQIIDDARATRHELSQLIDDWLERIDESIAAGNAVHANAYRLAELYVELPQAESTLRSNTRRVLDHYENTASTRIAILQNKRLVRARLEEQQKRCDAAIASYQHVRDLEPNSPAGEFAAERLHVVMARRQTKLTSNLGASHSGSASAMAVP